MAQPQELDLDKTIFVTGYPKSGNTWLSRLLGEVLNCPVGGYKGANPICTEGQDRPGKYYVAQLHMKAEFREIEEKFNPWYYRLSDWTPREKIVHIIRDPRDVAVSVKFYWDLPTIWDSIKSMAYGYTVMDKHGGWNSFVGRWIEVADLGMVVPVQYETLREQTEIELGRVLHSFNEKDHNFDFSYQEIPGAISRQEFSSKKQEISDNCGDRPYGRDVQLKLMRNGKVGDWRNHFCKEDALFADDCFGHLLRGLGYVNDRWVEEEYG